MVQHTGDVGAAEVQEVLLRLVGGERASAPSLERASSLPGSTRKSPSRVWMRVPARRQSSSLSHLNSACMASAMRQPWAKPNWVSTVRAAVRPKFSTRYFRSSPIATASSEERTLAGEADDASVRVELEQLLVVQLVGAHRSSLSFELKERVRHFD